MAQSKHKCENCQKTKDVFTVEDCFPDGTSEGHFICKKCFAPNRDPCPIKFYTVTDFPHKKVRVWDTDEIVREKIPKRHHWLMEHADIVRDRDFEQLWNQTWDPKNLSSKFHKGTHEKHDA